MKSEPYLKFSFTNSLSTLCQLQKQMEILNWKIHYHSLMSIVFNSVWSWHFKHIQDDGPILITVMFYPYVQIADDVVGYVYELPDIYILDIWIFEQGVQLSDVYLNFLPLLPSTQ